MKLMNQIKVQKMRTLLLSFVLLFQGIEGYSAMGTFNFDSEVLTEADVEMLLELPIMRMFYPEDGSERPMIMEDPVRVLQQSGSYFKFRLGIAHEETFQQISMHCFNFDFDISRGVNSCVKITNGWNIELFSNSLEKWETLEIRYQKGSTLKDAIPENCLAVSKPGETNSKLTDFGQAFFSEYRMAQSPRYDWMNTIEGRFVDLLSVTYVEVLEMLRISLTSD